MNFPEIVTSLATFIGALVTFMAIAIGVARTMWTKSAPFREALEQIEVTTKSTNDTINHGRFDAMVKDVAAMKKNMDEAKESVKDNERKLTRVEIRLDEMNSGTSDRFSIAERRLGVIESNASEINRNITRINEKLDNLSRD